MKKIISIISIISFYALLSLAQAQQIGNYLGDESLMYAETKQVNQFFRRFNNEENLKGERYSPSDAQYRENSQRKKYLEILFNKENSAISKDLKNDFIADITSSEHPQFLDFHQGEWYAEVLAEFYWKGELHHLNLFLELEQENLGYKWVISNVFFPPFFEMFATEEDQAGTSKFIHPMSHELDFMNLIKVFKDKEHLVDYTERTYRPDYLTLLIYEIKNGNLKFESVNSLNFHFFQIDGWYFKLQEFNRNNANSGWLINDLTKVQAEDKNILLSYILKQGN